MERKVIVESALVKYTKKGEYDYTLNSEYKEFESEKEARDFIENKIEKDYEFYLYHSQEDVENNEHFDVIISNNIMKMEELIKKALELTSNGNWSIGTEELRQAGITFDEFCEFLDNDERVCEYDKVDGEADIIFWLDYCPNLDEEEED